VAQKIKDKLGISPQMRATLVMPKQANSAATTVTELLVDFNALLAKLRAAGYIDS
jgi:hypothetical protein